MSRDQKFGRVVALPTAVGLSQARDAGCLRPLQLDSEGPCLLPEKEMANLKPNLMRNRKYNGERQEGVGVGGGGGAGRNNVRMDRITDKSTWSLFNPLYLIPACKCKRETIHNSIVLET